MKIAAAYIRVSTSDQLEYSPDSQLRLIKEYAKRNNIILNNECIFQDDGISGRDADKRPAFQEMVSMAKRNPKPFDAILVYSTSRFARNHEQSIVYRSMLERECGVEVISITQPNVDKKTDMLTTAIYSIIDEWYSLDLSDNVRRGMTQKAMKGGHQSAPPLGYEQKYPGATITIKEDEAEIVKYIFNQYADGTSKWNIARNLQEKGMKSKKGYKIDTRKITYILRNPIYKGFSRWTPTHRVYWDFNNEDTIVSKAKHEAIIDEKLYDEVQKKLDKSDAIHKKKSRPKETTKHWLSGIIKCSECGASLNYNGVTPTRKHPSLKCGGYGKGSCNTANFITVAAAESAILKYLRSIIENIDVLFDANINLTTNNAQEIGFLEKEISKLKGRLERSKQGFLNGVFDINEYKKLKSDVESEVLTAQNKIKKLSDLHVEYNDLQKDISNVYDVLVNPNFGKDEKQTALRSLIQKIVFNKKSGEFNIYFFR